MSVSTIGILQYVEKDVFKVRKAIKAYLNTIDDPNVMIGGVPVRSGFTCTVDLQDGFFVVHFWDGKARRTMYVFFNCDSDYPTYGPCVIFSLGAFGEAVHTISEVLKQCQTLGAGFLNENDCSDKPIVKLHDKLV